MATASVRDDLRWPELTPMEARFVEEFCVTWNPTKAATRAGYAPDLRSKIGSKLLAKPEVIARVRETRFDIAQRAGIEAVQVLGEIAAIAFADVGKFLDWGGTGDEVWLNIKSLEEIRRDPNAAPFLGSIRSLEIVKGKAGNNIKITFHDKMEALSQLGSLFSLFTPDNSPGGADNGPVEYVDRTRALLDRINRLASAGRETTNNSEPDTAGTEPAGAQLEVLGSEGAVTP